MRDSQTERSGVFAIASIITDNLKWIFREQAVVDVGIDAIIEQVIDHNPQGKFIAVQIKSGAGNFKEKDKSYTYYASNVHYHYWLNLNLPIILIAYFVESKLAIWEVLDYTTLKPTSKKWKVEIPKNKLLDSHSKIELNDLIISRENNWASYAMDNTNISDDSFDKLLAELVFIELSSANVVSMLELFNEFSQATKQTTILIEKYANQGLPRNDGRVKIAANNFGKKLISLSNKLEKEIEEFSTNFSMGFGAYEELSQIRINLSVDMPEVHNSISDFKSIRSSFEESIYESHNWILALQACPRDFPMIKQGTKRLIETVRLQISEIEAAKEFCDRYISIIGNRISGQE